MKKNIFIVLSTALLNCVSCESTAQPSDTSFKQINGFVEDVKNKNTDEVIRLYFELSDIEQSKIYKQQIDTIRTKLNRAEPFRVMAYEEWKSEKKNKLHELKRDYSVYCIVFFNPQLEEEDALYICFYKEKLFSIVPLYKGTNIVGWLPGQSKK